MPENYQNGSAKSFWATIPGFEPDPTLFSMLPSIAGAHFCQVAVMGAGNEGVLWLEEDHNSSLLFIESSNQKSTSVPAVQLDEFSKNKSF